MPEEQEQGWYADPWDLHDARWFSAGHATKLVRDGEQESYDDPPDDAPERPLTRVVDETPADGRDLSRADGPQGTLRQRMSDAAQYGATWGSHAPAGGQPPNRRE